MSPPIPKMAVSVISGALWSVQDSFDQPCNTYMYAYSKLGLSPGCEQWEQRQGTKSV